MPVAFLPDTRKICSKEALFSGLAISGALMIWRTQAQYGWIEIALGQRAWLYWISAVVWTGCAMTAKAGRERWVLILTAPPVVLPGIITGAVLLGAVSYD